MNTGWACSCKPAVPLSARGISPCWAHPESGWALQAEPPPPGQRNLPWAVRPSRHRGFKPVARQRRRNQTSRGNSIASSRFQAARQAQASAPPTAYFSPAPSKPSDLSLTISGIQHFFHAWWLKQPVSTHRPCTGLRNNTYHSVLLRISSFKPAVWMRPLQLVKKEQMSIGF